MMEIMSAVLPVAVIGGIVLFVVKRLEHKHKKGTLGKKETKKAQNLLDSLIPIGMLFGCLAGITFGMFLPVSQLTALSLGAGIGYLAGYVAYEMYSKQGERSS